MLIPQREWVIRLFIFEQKMQQKKVFLYCVLFYCGVGFAQFRVNGRVTTDKDIPLAGSHIHIGPKTVSSDDTGNYLAPDIPAGKARIYVSYLGYKSIDTLVVINDDLNFDFKLKENITSLNEVGVVRTNNTHNASMREQRIRQETIEKYSSQTLGDALKEVPGISSLKTGSTVVKPIINGLYGSRVAVISNNVKLEDQQWGTEHAPNFDVNAAGKITVIKGASGLQYGGDAVGGLVILEPLASVRDTLFGKSIATLSSNGRGGSISSSLHKGNQYGWSWNALGTFKYMGDRQAPDYVLSNTGNREANFTGDVKFARKTYDASIFYSFYNAEIGILGASHTGNVTDLYNSINNHVPAVVNDFTYTIGNPKQQVNHQLVKAALTRYWDDTGSLTFQYAYQFNKRREFDVRRGDYSNLAALDLELLTHTGQIDYKRKSQNWAFKAGISGSYQHNFANPDTKVRPLIPTYEKFDTGLYGIFNFDFSDSFIVESGIRYDFSKIDAIKFYQKSRWAERGYDTEFSRFIFGEQSSQWLTKPSFTFHNLSASVGFRKQFHHDWDWYANASLASRNPNPSELFSDGLHHATGIIELGELRLNQEKAFKLSTTVQKKWNLFSIDINPYLNLIQDYMFLQPVGFETTIRGAFPVWEYRQTNARLAGLDLHSRLQLSPRWTHDFTAAFVAGRDLSENEDLIDMPPTNLVNKIQYARKDWHALVLELKSEWVCRQNQYPMNNFETNIIVDGLQVPVVVDISTPPPAYHLLHFYSEVKVKVVGKTSAVIAFSVQNILNTSYRDYLNRQRFFADESGRNFQIQLKINY